MHQKTCKYIAHICMYPREDISRKNSNVSKRKEIYPKKIQCIQKKNKDV